MKTLASRTLLVSLLLGSVAGCSPTVANNEPATSPEVVSGVKHPDRLFQLADLAKTKATLGGKSFDLWIMDNESKRQEGMMFVNDADYSESEGMVFAFKDIQEAKSGRGFWMKNTISALDIIYFDKNKKLINVGKGVPQNLESVAPSADFQYVVELKQGTAAKLGLKPGDIVSFESPVSGLD